MATIDLELRIQTTGSVLAWEVFLESTSPSSRVGNWAYDMEKKCFIKHLPNFPVTDGILDVFVGSEGKIGGSTACTTVINGTAKSDKVVCNNTDKNYAHGTYNV